MYLMGYPGPEKFMVTRPLSSYYNWSLHWSCLSLNSTAVYGSLGTVSERLVTASDGMPLREFCVVLFGQIRVRFCQEMVTHVLVQGSQRFPRIKFHDFSFSRFSMIFHDAGNPVVFVRICTLCTAV